MYQFAPPWSAKPATFICIENLFTDEELNRIVEIGDSLTRKKATIGADVFPVSPEERHKDYRKCDVSYFSFDSDTQFVFDKLSFCINKENENNFGFDLYGFVESLQYTIYDKLGDHYDWHVDLSYGRTPYRKLTVSVQLSDPSEYEGGELQIKESNESTTLNKKLGAVSIFPSYTLHRVTPVTKGVRKSLVAWVNGKAFR
jgi:PKHD-type hydroxylase